VLDHGQADEVIDAVMRLETLDRSSTVTDLTVPGHG
jgi:hypothetical protein